MDTERKKKETPKLKKGHLKSHKTFLRFLYSIANSRKKVISAFRSANVNQLRVCLRLVAAVAIKEVRLTKTLHRTYLKRFQSVIRDILLNFETYIKANKETIVPLLIALSSVFRYIVVPLFTTPAHVEPNTNEAASTSEGAPVCSSETSPALEHPEDPADSSDEDPPPSTQECALKSVTDEFTTSN